MKYILTPLWFIVIFPLLAAIWAVGSFLIRAVVMTCYIVLATLWSPLNPFDGESPMWMITHTTEDGDKYSTSFHWWNHKVNSTLKGYFSSLRNDRASLQEDEEEDVE